MANYKSALCNPTTGYQPPITNTSAGEICAVRAQFAVPAAGLLLNDIVEMVPLPPNSMIVDAILAADDLDSNGTPLISLAVGVINTGGTDIDTGGTIIASNSLARAGGMARMDTPGALKWPSSNSKRNVGIKWAAAAATAQAGNVELTLLYRPAQQGE